MAENRTRVSEVTVASPALPTFGAGAGIAQSAAVMRQQLFFLACLVFSSASCQREDEIRSALAAKETTWQANLGTLKAQQGALKRRLPGGPGAAAAEVRARASLDAIAQSVADVETQMRQARPHVEQSLARGGEAGQRAFDEESAKMAEYLRGLEAELVTAGQQLDALGRDARGRGAQAE